MQGPEAVVGAAVESPFSTHSYKADPRNADVLVGALILK